MAKQPKFQHTATRRWLRVQFSTKGRPVRVSTHSHPKVAAHGQSLIIKLCWFQHTATRRWLLYCLYRVIRYKWFQHTATRRWLLCLSHPSGLSEPVSTHSHPKVAASKNKIIKQKYKCFNTQPPEGGCSLPTIKRDWIKRFQHTATRRWLPTGNKVSQSDNAVSTHSHPKVAAAMDREWLADYQFQHTATRRWLPQKIATDSEVNQFQHTATRRWLRNL